MPLGKWRRAKRTNDTTNNGANRVKTFSYRRWPRDAADVRLTIAVYLGCLIFIFPIAAALPLLGMFLGWVAASVGINGLELPLMLIPNLLILWASFRTIASRLEVTPDGLRVFGLGTAQNIAWTDITEIAPLSRGEAVAAIFRWPFKDWNLKCSTGLSFSGYVRIRHKNGVLLYAPENRAELLSAMQTHLSHRAAVQIPVYQWSETANVVATEIIQTLRR